ncbi:hypothetical protein BC938DRAFT_482068 [Jimgerdemannia flammicorona]|uniref:Uncharacterized protein n=1 Tax=Jimgerdemannia flammicorona TaxID=994334 RepID=A0A433QEN4_9FUNG|nr:hypothetical protein BC938DRAFT_482068 [Jimgerdemannia flammicorona]
MAKPKKSTKKFEKNHLRHTIEQRKKVQKFKKQIQKHDGKKDKRPAGPNGGHSKQPRRESKEDDEERGMFCVHRDSNYVLIADSDEPVDDEDNDEIEKGAEEIDEKYVFLCNFT